MEKITEILKNEETVIHKMCIIIEQIAKESIEREGNFKIGLSGGSLVMLLQSGLPYIKTDWSKWIFFFCDERVVQFDSPHSTFAAYKELILPVIPIKENQFVTINPELNGIETALDYEKKLKEYFTESVPRFHLLLLGIGPDGHTCSLFPGHRLLSETDSNIAYLDDSPKPPPCRITMTFPVINNAENVLIAVCGINKADIIKDVLVNNNTTLPVAQINLKSGRFYWILDEEAASKMI